MICQEPKVGAELKTRSRMIWEVTKLNRMRRDRGEVVWEVLAVEVMAVR